MTIIGSGLIAQAFFKKYHDIDDIIIYAAGVSNSNCTDEQEFARDRQRLMKTIDEINLKSKLVYFGTCSVLDGKYINSAYIQHKLEIEELIKSLPNYLILRLPQIAGKTPNPHTLLNYLHARIIRSEIFQLWTKAERNIIDIEDVAIISNQFIQNKLIANKIYNIANPFNYSITEIVKEMEKSIQKKAIYNTIERESKYYIDVSEMLTICNNSLDLFKNNYLEKVIGKYYGKYN